MDTGYKIYAETLRGRLERQLEEGEKLDETQFGFRRERNHRRNIHSKIIVDQEITREERFGRLWRI